LEPLKQQFAGEGRGGIRSGLFRLGRWVENKRPKSERNNMNIKSKNLKPYFLVPATAFFLAAMPAVASNVTLTADDTGSTYSFATAGNWNNGLAPSSGNAYFTSTHILQTTGTPITFAGGSLEIDSGGELLIGGGSTVTVNNLSLNGGTITQGNNNLTQTLAGSPITASATTSTLSGATSTAKLNLSTAISGSGGITIQNVVSMNVACTYSGDTTINASSTLKMGASSVMPNGTGKGNLIDNGTFDLAGRSETVNGLSGSGFIDVSGGTAGSSYTLTVDPASGVTATFSGVIQNTLGSAYSALTMAGAGGTEILTGVNTFTGIAKVTAGSLWINNSSGLGGGTKTITIQAGTDPELHLNGTNVNISLSSTLSFVTANPSGSGAIVNEAGNNTINGTISMASSGGSTLITVNAGTLTLAGNISIASGTSSSRGMLLGGAGNGTVSGIMSDLSGTVLFILTKNGSGSWTNPAASTFSGGVALNGGILCVSGTETPGTSGPLGKSGTISFAGGTLQYSSADSADYSSRFSTAAGQAYSIDTAGQSVTFATALTSASGSLTKSGAGTLTLNNTETYSSNTTVNAGTLTLGASGSIASSQTNTIAAGATFDVSAAGITLTGSSPQQTLAGGRRAAFIPGRRRRRQHGWKNLRVGQLRESGFEWQHRHGQRERFRAGGGHLPVAGLHGRADWLGQLDSRDYRHAIGQWIHGHGEHHDRQRRPC
jgi:autotransporter-associated beta strand protein